MSIREQRYNECIRLADHAKANKRWDMYRYYMQKAEEYR